MTHEEARSKAVDRMFTAIAHMNDYQDDEIEELLDEAVIFITEGVIQAMKHNVSHPLVRVKTLPEVRSKGWDDAIRAAVRVCDEFLKGDGYKDAKVTVKLLRERIRDLGGEG